MVPKVSIIVPIYNVEEYLGECLISLIKQTLTEIEIICVDDASTDSSVKIAKKCIENDPRFSLYQLKENKGLSYVRNFGMERATGKYLYFLDSDDYLDNNALEILYECAEKFKVQGIFFGAQVEYEENIEVKEYITYCDCERITTGKDFFVEVNRRGEYQNAVCFQFWNKSFIDENCFRFYEDIVYEDSLFTLKVLMKADRVTCIRDILYHYRKRGTSITANRGKNQLRSYVIVYFELLKIWLQSENANEIAYGVQRQLEVRHRNISMAIEQLGYIPNLNFEESACQYVYQKITRILPDYYYIDTLDKTVLKELSESDYLFVYGAGIIADEVIRYLEENDQKIEGLIVTNKSMNEDKFKGYNIYELEDIRKYSGRISIVLGLSQKYHYKIKEMIMKAGYKWHDLLKQV